MAHHKTLDVSYSPLLYALRARERCEPEKM